MKYELINTGRQPDNLYLDSWTINGFEITLATTIGAGLRVQIRKLPEKVFSHVWFADGKEENILRLINVAIGMIDNDQLHLAPHTTEKPFMKDAGFNRLIWPYNTRYIYELNLGNVLLGYLDIEDYFKKGGK